jgi:hypothetical protein
MRKEYRANAKSKTPACLLVISLFLIGWSAACRERRAAGDGTGASMKTSATTRRADAATTRPSAAAVPSGPVWQDLFDGKTLAGWKVSEFGGHGEPAVEDGKIILPSGEGLTGIVYTRDVPRTNYEVMIEAQRVSGSDFFCGLTFPVRDSFASLIIGGWGGGVVGISSLDGEDASRNETTTYRQFQAGKWYTIRLKVTDESLAAWVDDDPVIEVTTTGKRISVRDDISQSKPFGLASWQTTAAIKSVRVRPLKAPEAGAPTVRPSR